VKRIHTRRLLCLAGGLVCLLLLAWMAATLLLPGIVRGRMIAAAHRAGVELSGVAVESLGFRGTVVCDAVLESADFRATVPLLRVGYSMAGLLRGEIRSARISGSRVEILASGKQVSLADLDGVLRAGRTDEPSASVWQFKGGARLEGNQLHIDARVNMETGRGNIALQCPDLAAETLPPFLDTACGLLMRGNLMVAADVGIDAWEPRKTRFSLDSRRVHLFFSGAEAIAALVVRGEALGPFERYSLRADMKFDHLRYDRFSITEPLDVRLDADSRSGITAGVGAFSIRQIPGLRVEGLQARAGGSSLDTKVYLSGNLTFPHLSFLQRVPDLRFSAAILNQAQGVNWKVAADTSGSLRGGGDGFAVSAGIRGEVKASGIGGQGSAQVRVHADGFRAASSRWQLGFPGLSVAGRIALGSGPTYRGVVEFTNGEFSHQETGIRAGGVSGKIPFVSNGRIEKQQLSITRVDLSGIRLRNIQAEAAVCGRTAAATGMADLSNSRLKINFTAGLNAVPGSGIFELDFSLPRTELAAGSDLGEAMPVLAGFVGGGGIALKGAVEYPLGAALDATAEIALSGFDFTHERMKLQVEGLSGGVHFSRLQELRTEPSQLLSFRSFSLGPATVHDGRVQLQLHDASAGLLERLDFAFCGGRITTTAFRFPSWEAGMELDLICEHLRLADLLNMISGKDNATGEGTISGVIPIRVGADGISFKEAHLATSPGEMGTLRVSDPEEMAGGILLAEESIRDFAYEWAKVNIADSRERLNMVVQLSGKPRRKLPLKFDPGKRDFVRDSSGERLVDLKGLLLELKFVDIDINALLRESGLGKRR